MDENQTKPVGGKYDELTRQIIGVFYDVYNELGYGFLEVVYREAMRLALLEAGMRADAEVSIPVSFRGYIVGVFRADLVVNEAVLVELKTCEQMSRQQESQTMHYLKATQIEVGLLMNFGAKPQFKRFVMDNDLKQLRRRSVASVAIGVETLSSRTRS